MVVWEGVSVWKGSATFAGSRNMFWGSCWVQGIGLGPTLNSYSYSYSFWKSALSRRCSMGVLEGVGIGLFRKSVLTLSGRETYFRTLHQIW